MKDILIVARGGVVDAVFTDTPDVRVFLLDWDNVEEVADPSTACGRIPCNSLAEMPQETAVLFARTLSKGAS